MEKIYKEKIPSRDKRLGRHIEHDERSKKYTFDTRNLSIVSVKHKRYIPTLNQGDLGSCTGNAGIGDIATDPLFFLLPDQKEYTLDENGAVKLYSDAEIIDGGQGYPPEDNGSSGLSIAKALKKAKMIQSYKHTFSADAALKAGSIFPFMVGSYWYSDMMNPDPDGRAHPTGEIVGGHEYECDEIDAENKRVWFENSWVNPDGTPWGLNGRFYLTFGDFTSLLAQKGDVTILIPFNLKVGFMGIVVKILQLNLNKYGYNLVVDGIFGPKTLNAVENFQETHGLNRDGIVGPLTLKALQYNVLPQ